MRTATTYAYKVEIFMAGHIADAKRVCAQHCYDVGLCVTVTKTEYIYTGGRELGFVVGLVNYPRFKPGEKEVWENAWRLAERLISELAQHSALIQDHTQAVWVTRREAESLNA
jgi:hypothetical protein